MEAGGHTIVRQIWLGAIAMLAVASIALVAGWLAPLTFADAWPVPVVLVWLTALSEAPPLYRSVGGRLERVVVGAGGLLGIFVLVAADRQTSVDLFLCGVLPAVLLLVVGILSRFRSG